MSCAASTTVTAALAAGARNGSFLVWKSRKRDNWHASIAPTGRCSWVVNAGDDLIAGFDLGNSPAEYTAERVAGADDRVHDHQRHASHDAVHRCRTRAVGFLRESFGRRAALAATARVDLICAGTEGQVSWEDTLFAGAIVDRLRRWQCRLNDAALMALQAWRQIGGFEASR